MIAIDTSAAIAMILAEPGHDRLAQALAAEPERTMSAVSNVELVMVLSRTYSQPQQIAENFIAEMRIGVAALDSAQVRWAMHAFLTYGKGRNPARLNLGDCFSYAVAKAHDAPLLFVGNDFSLTDVRRG